MATATIHAPGTSWSGAVTACGRKAGETATDPAAITCLSPACYHKRLAHEQKIETAATTEATFAQSLRTEQHRGEPDPEAIAENDGRRARSASLIATAPSGIEIVSVSLGFHALVTTSDGAHGLYHMAKNLMDAAARARAIIDAREYAAEYAAQKASA